MYMVNQKVLRYGRERSCIRELFEYGRRQAAIVGSENVFDFSLGNPSVPPPSEVNDAIREILENDPPLKAHGYTSAVGADDTREAIAAALTERLGRPFTKRNICVTCGAAAALVSSLHAFYRGRDSEAVCIAPFFPEYTCFIEAAGIKQVIVPPDMQNFQIDLEALERALNENTCCVIINSPNNPTGAIYTKETLKALGGLLAKKSEETGHTIYLISDEPYKELVYDGAEVPYVPEFYPNTIICYSYSKSLSLSGDRIGYMCVPDCMENFDDVCDATTGAARACGYVCAPAMIQRVIAKCAHIMPVLEPYKRNRRLLYEGLAGMGYECVEPDGAFYLFVKSPIGSSKLFSDLAKTYNLLIVPGDDFGCPEYFRLSYCVDEDMIRRSLPLFERLMKDAQGKA